LPAGLDIRFLLSILFTVLFELAKTFTPPRSLTSTTATSIFRYFETIEFEL